MLLSISLLIFLFISLSSLDCLLEAPLGKAIGMNDYVIENCDYDLVAVYLCPVG